MKEGLLSFVSLYREVGSIGLTSGGNVLQVMKTYHMYNADSISAQSKLKEAEKQEEKQIGKSVKQEDRQTPRSPDSTANVRIEEKHVRRSSVKKIEKMKEKVHVLWQL